MNINLVTSLDNTLWWINKGCRYLSAFQLCVARNKTHSGGRGSLLNLSLIPSHLLSAFPDDACPSRVFWDKWGHTGLLVGWKVPGIGFLLREHYQGDFLLVSLPSLYSLPSVTDIVPPHVSPGAALAEMPWEPLQRWVCWYNKTARAGAVWNTGQKRSHSHHCWAGNNGDNYLIIPAASTSPKERVTGVQQCLCCK